jgi:hypothetical protein
MLVRYAHHTAAAVRMSATSKVSSSGSAKASRTYGEGSSDAAFRRAAKLVRPGRQSRASASARCSRCVERLLALSGRSTSARSKSNRPPQVGCARETPATEGFPSPAEFCSRSATFRSDRIERTYIVASLVGTQWPVATRYGGQFLAPSPSLDRRGRYSHLALLAARSCGWRLPALSVGDDGNRPAAWPGYGRPAARRWRTPVSEMRRARTHHR